MGSCFFVCGMRYPECTLNHSATKIIICLNFYAVCCLCISSILSNRVRITDGEDHVLILSHGFAIILFVLYILFLFFKIRTHSTVYESDSETYEEDVSADSANWSLGPIAAIVWLGVSLAFVALCMVSLVSSIPSSMWRANTLFFGFILIPFLGSVPDYLSAVVAALKNQMDITILATVESSTQLLLFTLPILVILGWLINEPLVLSLDYFGIVAVFLGVLVVRSVIRGGRIDYMSGAMCIAL